MASTLFYMSVAGVAIAILFLVAIIQNSVDESRIIATPNIPRQNGVLTSFASTKIKASAEDVFAVITNFKDYSAWTSFSEYKWKEVTVDGVPMVGSTGSFKLTIDGLGSRKVQVKLTLLDRESKRIAELSTSYPHWLLGSERVQEVVPIEGRPGYCEYRCWHTLEGIASYYLLFMAHEELSETQKRSAAGLRDFIEGGKQKR